MDPVGLVVDPEPIRDGARGFTESATELRAASTRLTSLAAIDLGPLSGAHATALSRVIGASGVGAVAAEELSANVDESLVRFHGTDVNGASTIAALTAQSAY